MICPKCLTATYTKEEIYSSHTRVNHLMNSRLTIKKQARAEIEDCERGEGVVPLISLEFDIRFQCVLSSAHSEFV